MKTTILTGLACIAGALAEVRLMDGIDFVNDNNNISNAIVERLYPGWRNYTFGAHALDHSGTEADTGTFNFVTAGITVAGYWSFVGYAQIKEVRDACVSTGTAQSGTFECIWQGAAYTGRHVMATLAGGFGVDAVTSLLTPSGEAQENKEKKTSKKRSCPISDQYISNTKFNRGGVEIKQTGRGACTLFPRGNLPYMLNIYSQLGEVAWAEHSALSVQWTMYNAKNGDVYARFHTELDTVATDICALYVDGSGCKF